MKALQRVASRIPHDRGPGLVSMFDLGEGRLGLEMIIDNLFEFDIAISEDESELLHKLAAEHDLDPKFMGMLRQVPIGIVATEHGSLHRPA